MARPTTITLNHLEVTHLTINVPLSLPPPLSLPSLTILPCSLPHLLPPFLLPSPSLPPSLLSSLPPSLFLRIDSPKEKRVHHSTLYPLKEEKGSPPSRSKQHSPDTISHSSTSTGSIGSIDSSPTSIPAPSTGYPLSRQASDPGVNSYQSPPKSTSPLAQVRGRGGREGRES